VMMACDGVSQIWASFKEAFGCLKHHTDHSELEIDVDKFASACSSTDPISFEHLVKLFDRDRHISRIEHFFMPTHFQVSLEEIKRRSVTPVNVYDSEGRETTKSKVCQLESEVSEVHQEVSDERKELDVLEQEVSEERREMDIMTDQINILTRRLDEQQSKHEIEQLQARREIIGLKAQMAQLAQMLGSLQMLGLKAMEEEKTASSSPPCGELVAHTSEEVCAPRLPPIEYSQSERQQVQDFNDAALPTMNDTPAYLHELQQGQDANYAAHEAKGTQAFLFERHWRKPLGAPPCKPPSVKEDCKEGQLQHHPLVHNKVSPSVVQPD